MLSGGISRFVLYRLNFAMSALPVRVRRWSPRFALAGLAVLLVLSGCRTYGDDFNRKAHMLSAIETANERFADELSQAQADLERLRTAAEDNTALEPYLERYTAAVATHEEKLSQHEEFEKGAATNPNDHRVLRRNLGAVVTDHSGMRDQYVRIIRAIDFEVNPERAAQRHLEPREKSQYQSTPPQYDQIRYRDANQLQMEDVLRG